MFVPNYREMNSNDFPIQAEVLFKPKTEQKETIYTVNVKTKEADKDKQMKGHKLNDIQHENQTTFNF